MESLDILVLAPHPDDAELCCGGLLLKARDAGLSFGIIDVTRGEMATRGSVRQRQKEAAAASRILKLAVRDNLGLPDGHLRDDETLRRELVRKLRRYRPHTVLLPHWEDQHPDHAAVGQAGIYAAWLAGAPRFEPSSGKGVASADRAPYRPKRLLHYNNRYGINADIVIDISSVIDAKMELARCYVTQFGPAAADASDEGAGMLQTRLSHAGFFDWFRGMHAYYGSQAGVQYGEAYCSKGPLCVEAVGSFFANPEGAPL
ncbi:MAG TPA: bacillithiol biosynthesis deacetylase BshB1 [Planctomycetota bacterium]|jgi:bacillithiol biosynthesis deacetylase BshB1